MALPRHRVEAGESILYFVGSKNSATAKDPGGKNQTFPLKLTTTKHFLIIFGELHLQLSKHVVNKKVQQESSERNPFEAAPASSGSHENASLNLPALK